MRILTAGLLVAGFALAGRAAAQTPPQPSPTSSASARQAQAASAGQGTPSQPSPASSASAGQAAPKPATGSAQAGRGGQTAAKPVIDAARADQLIEPPGFAYSPEGRRDPFVSLLRRGIDARSSAAAGAPRPAGLAGLTVNDITLRGTVRSGQGFVAILQGADQRTYIVRQGDRLLDGMIRTISQNDMVILQQVNDPLSLDKQREVRKVLRQTEAN